MKQHHCCSMTNKYVVRVCIGSKQKLTRWGRVNLEKATVT